MEHYLTVGQLKERLRDLPDDMPVYYQRIEDVYFTKHGWGTHSKFIPNDLYEAMPDEYLRAFTAFRYEDGFYITAHY